MAVQTGDIKLMRSERLGDTDDAGGRMTGIEVVDGASNNLFADVADLDRTIGRINLAKAFVNVNTPNTDSFYGVNVIIDQAPVDPAVSATLFTTANWFDHRSDLKDHIESYLAMGPLWQGYLYGNQLAGQRAIQIIQRQNTPLPEVGSVFVIVQDEGLPAQQLQYIRVTRVDVVLTAFFNVQTGRDYYRNVITVTIADPLLKTYLGNQASEGDPASPKSVLHSTIVADAAKYYGIQPLAAAASPGDFTAQAASIFTQLVPGATSETPMIDLSASGQVNPVTDSAQTADSFTVSTSIGPGVNLYLSNGCVPGSLTITGTGVNITDAAGNLYSAGVIIGGIDYGRGLLTFNGSSPTFAGTKTVSFHPAGAPLRVADTATIAIDINARGYAHTITLQPIPKPGTLMASYRAQGKWYDLRDYGDGNLVGSSPSFGSGRIDFATGSVLLTLGALPDINTEILFAWGVAASTFNRSNVAVPPARMEYKTANAGIAPGTVSITWTMAGVSKTALDNGHGLIQGDATGTVRYAAGELKWTPQFLPPAGTEFTISYDYGPPIEETFNTPERGGNGYVNLTLAHQDIRPDSVELEFNTVILDYDPVTHTPVQMQVQALVDPTVIARDNGSGGFDSGVTGSINYVDGTITFLPTLTVQIPKPVYQSWPIGTEAIRDNTGHVIPGQGETIYRNVFLRFEYIPAGEEMPIDGYAKVRYRAADSPTSAQETYTLANVVIDLTDRYAEHIVAGSIRFNLGGKTYIDRLGQLYCDVDPATGAGTAAGLVDYSTGNASLTVWAATAANQITMKSLLTDMGVSPVDACVFRIPVAPVRAGSLQIRVTTLPGDTLSATADANGFIDVPGMHGYVDNETGVVSLRFGDWVTAAGHEGEIWYDPNAVRADGKILEPAPVYADTIRYNAVATTYLPLPADILGLDPVRLPIDGRVPIFRVGDVAVIHHTDSAAVSSPQAGGTLDLGRTRLSRVWVKDAGGLTVTDDRYSVDLDAGVLTWATPLNLTGYTTPLTVYHRIEDMMLVSDVQIDGKLGFTRAVTHSFPAPGSQISSALVIGDLQARWTHFFDQQTWTSVWSDSVIGTPCTANYDTLNYPLVVTNDGATQERWALIFTGTTTYRCIGENVGQIADSISITQDFAPPNPATGQPYFTIKGLGFGGGWSAGNVIRFNTIAANYPVEIARTILQSSPTVLSDLFSIEIRGNADR